MSQDQGSSPTLDSFLQACACAWDRLSPSARRAVRATCQSGRLLHDHLLTQLCIQAGWENEHRPAVGPRAPTPAELHACVHAVLQRGAKLADLSLSFIKSKNYGHLPPREREQQLLAVLYACAPYPLPKLVLRGGIPHSKQLSVAMAAACPQLTHLDLSYADNPDLQAEECDQQDDHSYGEAIKGLLALSGPQLLKLSVIGRSHNWPTDCFSALQRCTALTSLELEAGFWDPLGWRGDPLFLGSVDTEACILSSVGTLTRLRSLTLMTNPHPDTCTPEVLQRHVSSLWSLTSLTALARLDLVLPKCYTPVADSYFRATEVSDSDRYAWECVREQQHQAILSAVRCMPRLEDFRCPTLWLSPSDTASLTSLTSLILGGLLPPPPPPLYLPSSFAVGGTALGALSGASGGTLPPLLRYLDLNTGASPRTLATLQLPPNLADLRVHCMEIGMSDVAPDGSILPETVDAFGPVLQLLLPYVEECDDSSSQLHLVVECGDLMRPRQGSLEGHAEWIKQLEWMDTYHWVALRGIAMQEGDLACLASTLPELKELSLWNTNLPLGALHALTGLQELQELQLDLTHLDQLTTEELAHVLCVLCREISTLEAVEVATESSAVDVGKCEGAVRAQLAAWGISSSRSAQLTITNECEADDDMGSISFADGIGEQGADGGEGEGSEVEGYYAGDRMEEGEEEGEEGFDCYLLDEW